MASTAREVAFASKPQPPPPTLPDATGDSNADDANADVVDVKVQYPEFVVAGSTPQEANAGNLYRQLHADDDDGRNSNDEISDTRDEDFAYLEAISERERMIQASQEDQVQKFLQQQSANINGNNNNNSAFVHEKALEALSKFKSSPAKRKKTGMFIPKVSKLAKITKKRSRFSHPPKNYGVSESEKPAPKNETKTELPQSEPSRSNDGEKMKIGASTRETETKNIVSAAVKPKETELKNAISAAAEQPETGSLGLGYDDVMSSDSEV